jgi:trehalose synthase-fused probable maltokinase
VIEELRAARWFGGKNRAIAGTRIIDHACWVANASLRLVEVQYASGPPDTYVFADRIDEPDIAFAVLERFRFNINGSSVKTEAGGALVFRPTRVFQTITADRLAPVVPMRGEQSNTSIRFGDALILKLFRRLQYGPNPDVEVGLFLTEHSHFRGTPPVAGSLTYVSPEGREASLALLQGFESNRGDAWTTTLARVRDVLRGGGLSESVTAMARLGQTTAELHLALAGGSDDFGADPITDADVAAWRQAIHAEVHIAAEALARHEIRVDTPALLRRADGVGGLNGTLKIRHHGDYHLGQVLERANGSFAIIDFEGEPSRPLAQRREKRSSLRDVAGMLRSFDYARHAGLRALNAKDAESERRADAWYAAVREAFLEAYLATVHKQPELMPEQVEPPLAALELEKATYEVLYELNNRPDWLPIPLAALTSATLAGDAYRPSS